MQQYFQSPLDFQQAHTGGSSAPWHASGDGLVLFQLCLYHKLESPVQFTSVKSCPRCEHTLDLAQSVCCTGPQACNRVRHAAYWCCIQVVWEKNSWRPSNQDQRPGGIQEFQIFRGFNIPVIRIFSILFLRTLVSYSRPN